MISINIFLHKSKYSKHEQFASAITNINLSDVEYEKILDRIGCASREKIKYDTDFLARLNSEKKKYEIRLEKIYDDKLDGLIDDSLYIKKRTEIVTTLEKIGDKLASNNGDKSQFYFTLEKLVRLFKKHQKSSEILKWIKNDNSYCFYIKTYSLMVIYFGGNIKSRSIFCIKRHFLQIGSGT